MSTNFPTSLDSYATLVDGTDILEAADQNNARDAIEALEAKVGIDGSAVAASHDYKIDALEDGPLTSNGSTVFNGTLTTADVFQDLDLSAYVGSNSAIVFLEVYFATSSAFEYAVRPKGYGGSGLNQHMIIGSSGYDQCGAATMRGGGPVYGYLMCMTNASGVLQHACSSISYTAVVKLVGYIKGP
jgi:hypothetical protein